MKKIIPIILSFNIFVVGLVSSVAAQQVLTWHDTLKEAQKNNSGLISAQWQIKQKQSAKQIALSEYLPSIDAVLNHTRSQGSTRNYSAGLSSSWVIFNGFKTLNQVKASQSQIESAQENYHFVSSETRKNLRSAFINLLKAQELVVVSQEIEKIRKYNLDLISLRYDSGLEHQGALLTAEANLAQAQVDLAQSQREIELAQFALNKELGREKFINLQIVGELKVISGYLDHPNFDEIIQNHPTYRNVIFQKNEASFNIALARSNFSPEITLTSGYDKSGSKWIPQSEGWDAGVSISLSLFQGGANVSKLRQAKEVYYQIEVDEKTIKDTLRVNLLQSWNDLQDALMQVAVKQKILAASQERSRIAEAQYSTGFINFDNWIIIQNDLVQAKKTFLNAQAEALTAEAMWRYAKGDTVEYED